MRIANVGPSNGTGLDIFMIIKRIACAALALSLLGSTAASAAPWGGHGGWHHGHGHGWRGVGFLGLGLGLLTLGAIAHDDAVDRDRERYEREEYYRDRERAYAQDRDFRDHGFEPGTRGGAYQGEDGYGPGAGQAYRGRSDADRGDQDADRDGPPPPHQRAYRDAPPAQDGYDGPRDDARGAPHPLHQDDDGED